LVTHLQLGAIELGKALKNPSVRKEFFELASTFESNERKIYFTELLQLLKRAPGVNTANVQKAITAFSDLDGMAYRPFVSHHLPEKDAYLVAGVLQEANNNEPGAPTDVIAFDEGWPEGEMPYVPGYEVINGEIWPIEGLLIDEPYYDAHEILVFGIDPPEQEPNIIAGVLDNCGYWLEPTIAGKIKKVTLKVRKEHFLGNNSDLAILRATSWSLPAQGPFSTSTPMEAWSLNKTIKRDEKFDSIKLYFCTPDFHGDLVKKVRRRDVKDRKELTIDFSLIKSWKPQTGSNLDVYTYPTCIKSYCVIKGDLMYYNLFESDPWPAPLRTVFVANPVHPQNGMEITYRSWESPFVTGTINYVHPAGTASVSNIKGHFQDNSEFRFSTIAQ
jgi:hypothetical protein